MQADVILDPSGETVLAHCDFSFKVQHAFQEGFNAPKVRIDAHLWSDSTCYSWYSNLGGGL